MSKKAETRKAETRKAVLNEASSLEELVVELGRTIVKAHTDQEVSIGELTLAVIRGEVFFSEFPAIMSNMEGALRGLKDTVPKTDNWQLKRMRHWIRQLDEKTQKLERDFKTVSLIISIALDLERGSVGLTSFLKRLRARQ